MPVAVADTNILFAWRSEFDQHHQRGREICTAASENRLPKLLIPQIFLQETLKHVHNEASYVTAIQTLDRLVRDRGFSITNLREEDYDRGRAIYRQFDELEYPDAVCVAYMRREQFTYIYSFDSNFDVFSDITRFNSPHNPFAP